MTNDEIVYLINAHYATSGEINDVIIFARAIEHCTLTKQKAKWYQEGVEAGLRQALAEPDTGIDRGAWSDVPSATKWVDELRGGDEQSEWVELTDEDIEELRRNGAHSVSDADFRAIEAKLKELNNA